AEDGIRDGHVTGVQTCALPISSHAYYRGYGIMHRVSNTNCWKRETIRAVRSMRTGMSALRPRLIFVIQSFATAEVALDFANQLRSEERRVGKEWNLRCRSSLEK